MQQPVLDVEPRSNSPIQLRPTEAGTPRDPAAPGGRFTYACGSQPLTGYTVKRGIGHGGFGEVYYATSDAGKEVALKLIRRNLDIELRGVTQCLNLKHPNLIQLFDIRRSDDDDAWVIMEYVTGSSLEEVIEGNPDGMPEADVLRWFHGIASAVAYLHDHGIVHRDLKPGNIFSDEGVVKIGDYGLSKFISCSRRSGQTESVGTVHYMAPEVANGRYGKQIDIYALGIVLYEMLTGRVPFDGESVGEVLMKHLTAEPELSGVAEPYRGVIARALRKDPEQRFESVREMISVLPKPVGSASAIGPLPVSPHRTPAAAPAAAAAAAAGATAAAAQASGPTATPVDDEPIGRLVGESWRKLRTAWDQANLHVAVKVALLIGCVFVLIVSFGALVSLVGLLLLLYVGYRIVRAVVLAVKRSHAGDEFPHSAPPAPSRPQATPAAAAAVAVRPPGKAEARARAAARRCRRRRWTTDLPPKSPRQRVTELTGSLLVGALVAGVMCVVVLIVNSFRHGAVHPSQCGWLVLVSIAGTWSVLAASKAWEGTDGDDKPRRFVMMVLGLAVGAFAYYAAEMFLVRLPGDEALFPGAAYRLPASFYGDDGSPQLLAYLAAFGTMFLLIRWWRAADPRRSTRLSLMSMIVCTVLAGLVAGAWHFPQPWLPMVAAAMSVSIQLASPWLADRRQFAQAA